MSVATMLPSTHACELSSTLGFTSLPVNYVEWQYCTFLCDNLSRLLGPPFIGGSSPICLPANNDRLTSSLVDMAHAIFSST